MSPFPTPQAVQPADADPGATGRGRSWVPIRSLGPRHRTRISTHLIALDERSRYLRFGYAATDAQIHRYVDMIDFEQDEDGASHRYAIANLGGASRTDLDARLTALRARLRWRMGPR